MCTRKNTFIISWFMRIAPFLGCVTVQVSLSPVQRVSVPIEVILRMVEVTNLFPEIGSLHQNAQKGFNA